jgi:hypothetical protein
MVTAFEYLKRLPRDWLPKSLEHGIKPPSNSELFRWLRDKGIIINGETPSPHDNIEFPIRQLIFFPKSERRTTMAEENHG